MWKFKISANFSLCYDKLKKDWKNGTKITIAGAYNIRKHFMTFLVFILKKH